jgi:protein-tyrosine phosphatase
MAIKAIKLEGMRNFRELGGIPTKDGRKIASGKFYRCGSLKKATPETMKELRDTYGIKTIIDLRTDGEQEEKPDPSLEGIEHLSIGILEEATQGISHEKRKDHQWYYDNPKPMGELYHDMGTMEYCKKQFGKVVRACLDREGGVAFHCSVGKDRTGIVAYLILTILGVDKKLIMKDYVYTNKVAKKNARKYARKCIAKRCSYKTTKTVYQMLTARPEFLLAFEQGVIETEGSMDNYLRTYCNIGEKEIAAYREKFLG